MIRTDFWTLWEKARMGCFDRTALKHVYYQGWNISPAQVGCMRQVLEAGALGRTRGIGWGGKGERGLGRGIHINPWLIHVNVWQKPLQYCKVISLQLMKINGKKIKVVKRDKEGHYITIKGWIQEDITIINIYAPNIGTPKYVRQMLTSMKGEMNNNTKTVGDFNTPLTPMDRWTKQKINKETQTLNDTMYQLDLIYIYRTFHPKTINFAFFSSAHGTFSRTDHILNHKSSLGKLKKKKMKSF